MFSKVMFYVNSVLLIIVSFTLISKKQEVRDFKVKLSIHEQLIEECEKSLPRDKTCKLVAVEESE